jgi:hypothetical protein
VQRELRTLNGNNLGIVPEVLGVPADALIDGAATGAAVGPLDEAADAEWVVADAALGACILEVFEPTEVGETLGKGRLLVSVPVELGWLAKTEAPLDVLLGVPNVAPVLSQALVKHSANKAGAADKKQKTGSREESNRAHISRLYAPSCALARSQRWRCDKNHSVARAFCSGAPFLAASRGSGPTRVAASGIRGQQR